MALQSAIIDSHSSKAFMVIANEEGLLKTRHHTNGVFKNICKSEVDCRIREQLLEQIVLTPNIALYLPSYSDWFVDSLEFVDDLDGELKFKENIIAFTRPGELTMQAQTLPIDIICGLVQARGGNIPYSEFKARADAARAAAEEEDYPEISVGDVRWRITLLFKRSAKSRARLRAR